MISPILLLLLGQVLISGSVSVQGNITLAGGAASGGGTTYLINEGFEGTGVPTANWFTSSADYDYTSAPLDGSQSCRLTSGAYTSTYHELSSETAEVWGKFLFKMEGGLPSAFENVFYIERQDEVTLANVIIGSDGKVHLNDPTGPAITSVSAIVGDTLYYIWWHYKKVGVGSSVCELWFSSSNVKPADGSNNHVKYTTGTFNDGVRIMNFIANTAGGGTIRTIVIDDVQMAATSFQ